MPNRHPGVEEDFDTVNTDEQLNVRIAWCYYVSNMTQQQIADRFGITRLRVNKALAVCRETGVVQIRINSPLASCVALEEKLRKGHGLHRATVVPTPDDPRMIFRALGVGLAATVDEYLHDDSIVGVGWGRTLRHAVRELRGRALPNMTVLSLLGGLHYGSANNTVELASSMATALGGNYYYLAAPVFAPSAAYRDMILAEPSVQDVLAKARQADLALLTVGDLSERSLMIELGLVKPDELRSLKAAGAVGDLLGRWLDRHGQEIDHPLNRRAISLDPQDLRHIRKVVLVSGGPHKTDIVRAVLQRGLVHELVTDEATAERLLHSTRQER